MTRAAVLGLALALALGAWGCSVQFTDPRPLSDGEMIARFRTERASFDSLVAMLGGDRSIRDMSEYGELIDTGGRSVTRRRGHEGMPGLSAERWEAYQRLLHRAGIAYHVQVDSAGIRFVQAVRHAASRQDPFLRGYYYARLPLSANGATFVTDAAPDSTRDPLGSIRHAVYRQFDGAWFLYTFYPGFSQD